MSSIFDTSPAARSSRKLNLVEFWRRLGSAEAETNLEQALRHVQQVYQYIVMRPFAFFFTIVTAALALAVFASVLALAFGSQALLSQQGATIQATVFVRDAASQAQVDSLQAQLAAYAGVERVTLTTKEQALQQFKSAIDTTLANTVEGAAANISMADIAGANNPLPRSLELTLRTAEAPAALQAMKGELQKNSIVEMMQFASADVGLAATIGQKLEHAVFIVIPLGMLLVGFLIATTVRLSVAASIEEIHIMWILGARRRFVYAPFLIHSLLQGLLAGLLALAITAAARRTLLEFWNEAFVPLGISLAVDTRHALVSLIILCSAVLASFFAALLALRSSTREQN